MPAPTVTPPTRAWMRATAQPSRRTPIRASSDRELGAAEGARERCGERARLDRLLEDLPHAGACRALAHQRADEAAHEQDRQVGTAPARRRPPVRAAEAWHDLVR